MTRAFCPSALGLMDNAQNVAMIEDFRKCEKYLTLPPATADPQIRPSNHVSGYRYCVPYRLPAFQSQGARTTCGLP